MKNLPLTLLLWLLITSVYGQDISIEGDVDKPLTMSMSDIEKLPVVEIKGKDKDANDHTFKGASLFNILQAAGIPAGNKSFMSYVQITAADNYKVIFTIAELDPAFTSQVILLATSVDGKPLPKGEGPFRVVAINDKKHARWIREVISIKLISIK